VPAMKEGDKTIPKPRSDFSKEKKLKQWQKNYRALNYRKIMSLCVTQPKKFGTFWRLLMKELAKFENPSMTCTCTLLK